MSKRQRYFLIDPELDAVVQRYIDRNGVTFTRIATAALIQWCAGDGTSRQRSIQVATAFDSGRIRIESLGEAIHSPSTENDT